MTDAKRLVVATRRCPFCGIFHTHRLFVDLRPGSVVTYASCPETKNMLTIHLTELE